MTTDLPLLKLKLAIRGDEEIDHSPACIVLTKGGVFWHQCGYLWNRRSIRILSLTQIKSFLRGESLPFSSGELEGINSLVNIHVRVAKKLQSSSLRYWLLEYFRRQPRERKFSALILRFIKDRIASLFLVEVGIQASAVVSSGKQIGDEIEVFIDEAHPRDDILSVREV